MQHDNLTKLSEKFRKTGKFDKGANQYFGIDAEKEFAKVEAKVKKPKIKDEFFGDKDIKKEWDYEMDQAAKEVKQEDKIIKSSLEGMDERQLLKIKYPGTTDDLLNKILIDNNPQRKAEVMATMDEYLKLREVGKSEGEAHDIITTSFKRKKQASGGLAGMLGE